MCIKARIKKALLFGKNACQSVFYASTLISKSLAVRVKFLAKNVLLSVFYISIPFLFVLFMTDKIFFRQNWFNITEILSLIGCSLVVIFFIQFSSQVSEFSFGIFKLVRSLVEETTVKWLLVTHYQGMIEEIGVKLEHMSGAQDSSNNARQLHKISKIKLEDKLPEKEKNELRELWNKYVLRELACQCLAFFDKPAYERKKIRSSFDLYHPSPQEVLKSSEKASFKEQMKKASNDEAIKQFEVLLKHFDSSYQADRNGDWLNWSLPEIISSFQK